MRTSTLKVQHPKRSGFLPHLSRIVRTAVATVMAFALAFVLPSRVARAESEGVGKLGAIIGKAFIIRDGQKLPAQKGMAVFPSDALATEPKAVVKILFADGGSFMAFENSSVKIEEYAVKKDGEKVSLKSAFDIAKGKVRFFVKPGENRNNDATYKTKNAVMGIRGTSGFIDTTGGNTQLVVTTGKVAVSNPVNPSVSVLVPANHMTNVVGKSLPTEPKLAPPELLSNLKGSADQVSPGSSDAEQEKQGASGKSDSKEKQEGDEKKDGQDKKDDQDKQGKSDKQESNDSKSASSQKESSKEEDPARGKDQPESAQSDDKPGTKAEANKESEQKQPASNSADASTEKKQESAAASKGEDATPSSSDGAKKSEEPRASSGTSDKPQQPAKQNATESKSSTAASGGSSSDSSSASPAAPTRSGSAGVSQPKPAAAAPVAAPAPEAVPVKKVTVFSQDGSSSVSVGDQSMSRMATKIETGAVPQPAPRAAPVAAPAAVPAAQVTGAAAAVQQVQSVTSTQKIQEQIQTSVTKAIEQTTSVVEAVKAAPVVTPPPVVAPTSKSVKVKIVLPTN